MVKALSEKQRRELIVDFYQSHKEEGKIVTIKHFAKMGISKRTVYNVIKTFETRGETHRKRGSGRQARKMTKRRVTQLKSFFRDKIGASTRSAANKFGISNSYVHKQLKREGLVYHKRGKAPKVTEAQQKVQKTRVSRLYRHISVTGTNFEFVMDDESYFHLGGDNIPQNQGFYTDNIDNTPFDVKNTLESKFPEKVLVWVAICPRGISTPFFMESGFAVNKTNYQRECINKRLVPFIKEMYGDVESSDYIFWPDLASAHYARDTVALYNEKKINFVQKEMNPPNCPQLRPIEDFWGCLKQKVYVNGWHAKDTAQLIRRVRKKIKEVPLVHVQALLLSLKSKIRKARDKGLEILCH